MSNIENQIHNSPTTPATQAPPQAPTSADKRLKRTSDRKHKRTRPQVFEDIALRHDIPRINIQDMLEVLAAIHFSSYVGSPIEDAGGLMLVAPSGSLKSQLLMTISNLYPSKCICDSNWYYGKFMKMQGSFYNRSIRSIVIPELASIYAGDPRTGGRVEQLIQQLAGEGSLTTNQSDSRFARYMGRATVFAALTPTFAEKKHEFWEEGFHRRFLWAYIAMEDDEILLDYLEHWRRAELEMSQPIIEPSQGYIPNLLTPQEKHQIRGMLLSQKAFGPNQTRFIVFAKAIAVLKWHYKRLKSKKNALDTAKRFSACLSDKAALLVVPKVHE